MKVTLGARQRTQLVTWIRPSPQFRKDYSRYTAISQWHDVFECVIQPMKVNPLRKSRVPGEGWDGTNLEQLSNATHEPFVGNWSTHESLGSNSIELELRNFDVFRSVLNRYRGAIKIWTNRRQTGPPGAVRLERDQIRRPAACNFRLIGVISGLMRSVNRRRLRLS